MTMITFIQKKPHSSRVFYVLTWYYGNLHRLQIKYLKRIEIKIPDSKCQTQTPIMLW